MAVSARVPWPLSLNLRISAWSKGAQMKARRARLDYVESARWALAQQGFGKEEPTEGPLSAHIVLHPPDKRRKRDVDNSLKIVLDAATGYLWRDDSQVRSLLVEFGCPDPPRGSVVLTVTAISDWWPQGGTDATSRTQG